MQSPRNRLLRRIGCGVLAAGLACLLAFVAWEAESLPEAKVGPEAEALAVRLETASNLEAWQRTGAVRWTFAGRNRHLWDRARRLAQVETGDRRVLLNLATRRGRAWEGEQELQGEQAEQAVAQAYGTWVNDSFWLNPLETLRDPGVSLAATAQGELLVSYSEGGLTPGDRYLWVLGDDGLPTRWKVWVSIVPIPGADVTWDDWETLATGAQVSCRHRMFGVVDLVLSDVSGASTLAELEPGEDPLAPLLR